MNLKNYELEQEVQSGQLPGGSVMTNQSETIPRKGEQGIPVTFRTNRFFSIGADWYFSTREGIDQGPYQSKELAQAAIEKFIREIAL
ncbi:MAG: DUF6316 family protein [Gammaproteobacteria bacterium]|nr:DUF6316 family protein [Gammaproteobacteria bacterium]